MISTKRPVSTRVMMPCLLLTLFHFTLPASAQDPISQVGSIIASEFQRHQQLERNLQRSSASISALIEDLMSNELRDDTATLKMESLSASLGQLSNQHMAIISKMLRQARNTPQNRSTSLADAHSAINSMISGLQELIDEANLEQKKRIYNVLLQGIIEDQWSVLKNTVRWGRSSLSSDVSAATRDSAEIRMKQEMAQNKLISFLTETRTGAKNSANEDLRKILEDVTAAIEEQRVVQHQTNAIQSIAQQDAAAATGHEQQALKGLQDALDVLNGVEWGKLQQLVAEAELKEKIREIVEKQKALRLQLLQTDTAQLPKRAKTFASQQHQLFTQLKALEPDLEKVPAKAIIGPAIKIAGSEMLKAETHLNKHHKQAASGAQLRVITTLEEILSSGEEEEEFADVPFMQLPLGLTEFSGTVAGMEPSGLMQVPEGAGLGGMGPGLGIGLSFGESSAGFSIPIGGGFGPPGMAAGEGMAADGGFGESDGPTEPGLGEAGAAEGGIGPGSGEAMGQGEGMGGEEGPPGDAASGAGHRWGSDLLSEDEAKRGAQTVGHLGSVARQQIQQLYEMNLPPEYRGMAQDYFEILASGEQ